ncbi:hypothetical protein [Mucilaginibacter lacusdianchii]|uniref:hypothetical protein n=1 Tax=Mucilaginibacter lacusdianchii TaxID=2684211 RepID=UPI00131B6DED|nr:hypothetical protein [Mucilaginibacter sp. JXJ CY 39]
MKKSVTYTCAALLLAASTLVACHTQKNSGSKNVRTKDMPSPSNTSNTDSTGTTPSVKLTPAPVPNVRPNPTPNPVPPNPPM